MARRAESLDVETMTWARLEDMPAYHGRGAACGTAWNSETLSRIVVVAGGTGGYLASDGPISQKAVSILDVKTLQWAPGG